MTEKSLNEVLKKFDEILERNKKIDKAIKDYWGLVSPTNYTPFLEYDELSGFLSGIKLLNNDLGEELEDWLYQGYTIPSIWEVNGREFRIDGYEDFKKYLYYKFVGK